MNISYHYSPLIRAHDIRVLQLAPGKDSNPLKGQIHYVNLDLYPAYETLSYEWGNPKKGHAIYLNNGTQIAITKSLYDALQDIRHEKESRVIWADGICINQDNIEERQDQVSIMGIIYSKASQILTYIGTEKDDSIISIDFAYELIRKHESAEITSRNSFDNPTSLELPPLSGPRYLALKKLILRGWSSRSWCAHEFLLNKDL
jgi:Heterokaryon incompatibility protein (HET)